MFKHILLPTDGSHLSELAVLAGISLAKDLGAKVVGVTAIPEFHAFTFDPELLEATKAEFLSNAAQQGARHLAFISDAARSASVSCTVVDVVSDDPHAAILQTVKDHHCDLIVMASHGRKGITGVLLGSETQKVLVHSDVPVLVYR